MEVKISNTTYGTCRFCSEKGQHKDVFKEYYWNGIKEIYLDMILECFNIFLTSSTNFNSLVCLSCITKLRDANNFRSMILNSEQKFLNMINGKDTVYVNVPVQDHVLEVSGNIKAEEHFDAKQEFEEEICDDVFSESDFTQDDKDHCDNPSKNTVANQDIIEREAALLARFPKDTLKLPTRETLKQSCPEYFRCLEQLKGQLILPHMIKKMVEDADKKTSLKCNRVTVAERQTSLKRNRVTVAERQTSLKRNRVTVAERQTSLKRNRVTLGERQTSLKRKRITIAEKMAYIDNASTLLEHSNATPFKSANRSGFPCFYCRVIFDNLEGLQKHQLSKHKKSEIRRILGAYEVYSLVVYADITDLTCTICSEKIQSLNDLKSHLIKVHKKTFHTELPDIVVPFKLTKENVYECQLCGFSFETFGSMERHMNVHFRNYVCTKCGAGFVTKYRLTGHTNSKHASGSFPCEQCGKVFAAQQKLKDHVDRMHKMLKKFRCPKCPERFSEYSQRRKHVEKDHGGAPLQYKCNVCTKTFNRRYTLSVHIKRDHLDERNINCELCPYKCSTSSELKVHMVRHNGEKPFECPVCKKCYTRNKTLKGHMRIHNNDRRYVCASCGQAFVQKCSLNGHMKTHHSDMQ